MTIYGKQLFLYVLENHPSMIDSIYLAKEIDKKLFSKIVKIGKKIIRVDNKKAQAMARGGNHQGFILELSGLNFSKLSALKHSNFLVVLCSLTDVGNIGAIIRSAYAMGVDGIVISGIKSINLEALARSSSGALFDMPVVLYQNTLDLLNELKQSGFKTYGADMDGVDIREVDSSGKKALFMGGEEAGLPKRVLKKLDKIVSIKMERDFESLNVSAACAILCDRMR